jgi:HlyD family secretion protein
MPNSPGRIWTKLLLALVAVAILAAAGSALRHRAAAGSATQPFAAEVLTVTRGTVEKSVESAGKVVPNLEVDIKCRASGEVVQLPVDISQKVKRDDLLCQLDKSDAELAVKSAQVAVETATARLAQATYTLEQGRENLKTSRARAESALRNAKIRADNTQLKTNRQQELFDHKLASREDLESAQTELAAAQADQRAAEIAIDELKQTEIQLQYKEQDIKTAQAQLESAQITLDTQKRQLGYTTVKSPIDGTVTALSVQKGTIVASGISGFSGGTTIMTLADLSHIFMTATVDESDIGGVQVGQPARIKVASFPGRTFNGQVVRKATKGVNTNNVVTFEVKVEVLDDHKDLLQPEMTGSVTIIEAAAKDVLTLSQMAIDRQNDKAFVTTTTGQRKEITLGLQGQESAEVTSGLNEGDKLLMTTAGLPTRWKTSPNGGPPPR